MNIVLFLKIKDPLANRVEQLVKTIKGYQNTVKLCRTEENLESTLRSSRVSPEIILLSIPDTDTLNKLMLFRDLLLDARVVEIVADHSNETINLAHKLHPRYLHYQWEELGNLASVLDNILRGEA
jgi:hypothetical protein